MRLVGRQDGSIDSKSRLGVGHGFRRQLSTDTTGHSFYVVPGERPGTLDLYPEKVFEAGSWTRVPFENLSQESQDWVRFMNSQAALLESDTQGRVLIPERLLKRIGVDKDENSAVTLVGMTDRLTLWPRSRFEAFEEEQWNHAAANRVRAIAEIRSLAPATGAATGV